MYLRLNNYKKDFSFYLFQKKLIRAIVGILLLFSLLTGIVFYSLEKNSYYEHMTASNNAIINQIASIYELYIQNIREFCNHSILYDNTRAISDSEYRLSASGKTEILEYLISLSVSSEYIHSCHLYFFQDDLIYTTYSMPATVTHLDTFYDAAIFQDLKGQSSLLLDPRFIDIPSGYNNVVNKPLVITLIIAMPINGFQKTAYLAVNIDAYKLYANIFEELQISTPMNFYIIGSNNNIIFHNNTTYLFTNYEELEPTSSSQITSACFSAQFNWTFVLENTIPTIKSSIIKFFMLIILILIVLLVISIGLTVFYTMPIKKMLQTSKNLRWRYFLTTGLPSRDTTTLQNLNLDTEFPDCTAFSVLSYKFTALTSREKTSELLLKAFYSHSEKWQFCFHPVHLSENCFCMILGFSSQDSTAEISASVHIIANEIMDTMEKQLIQAPICSISSVKSNYLLLHEAWLEVCEIDKYSYSLTQTIRCYTAISSKAKDYEYPYQHEKQLINNLLVGNLDGCKIYLEKIFSSFLSDTYILENASIQKYLYLIQNNILSNLASMPMPIKTDTSFSLDNYESLQELQDAFEGYLTEIVEKINSKDSNEKVLLYDMIIDYINQHYHENTICLNIVADYFNLNANYISKIVKETTNKSFTNYITFLRIKYSKELLQQGNLTVNEISDAVGFSYPYYFIRKFKESEGITPGQYVARDTTLE